MDILTNIMSSMKKKNLSQKQLCDKLGLSKSSFSEWKSGKTTSYMQRLPEIASILGVPISQLVSSDKENTGLPSGKNERQARIDIAIDLFGRLTPQQQELVIAQIRGIHQSNDTEKE